MSQATLEAVDLAGVEASLRAANRAFGHDYPGDAATRQPVHTVYGGAHLFKFDTAARLGQLARQSLRDHAPDAATLAACLDFSDAALAETLYARVCAKLETQAIEDFRLDFEDGYGNRPAMEEDAHAESAALEVARGLREHTLPLFIGIRIKPFTEALLARGVRTLDLFLTTLVTATGGQLPERFVVTLPKVTVPEQVAALASILQRLETKLGLVPESLRLEIMVETSQAILGRDGCCPLPAMVRAAAGRCVGAHFGAYDYTASCNITAAAQSLVHPACDFARHVMQVALGGTGVALSDGATNLIPVGPHRMAKGGPPLTAAQHAENSQAVQRAWQLNYTHVRHALRHGYYQGWDLHPAQLPVRYAAVYAFFLEGLPAAAARLRAFLAQAARATLSGGVFDDAATGQGLLNFFLRGMASGALAETEALSAGLSLAELRTRSFLTILAQRAAANTPEFPGA